MPERSADWLRQAKKDLENASWEVKGGFFEWACFSAQQAAEKAIKAVYQKLGGVAWGHSVYNLLRGLQEKVSVPEELLRVGQKLDRYYIPARYPNGWEAGIPHEYFTEEEAREAIRGAGEIIRFCEDLLAGPRRGPEKG